MEKLAGSFHVIGRFIRHWLLLWFCLYPIFLTAQNYPTQHFTMRDGLPSMAIRCIYKDTRGLMWIGTDAGLCSFDGKSFRIFKPSEGMTANMVWAIAEDEEGNMWFGSYGEGLYKYNGKNFERFTKKNGLASDFIRALCYSKNFHCLIVGGQRGINSIKGKVISTSPGEIFNEKNGNSVMGIADAGKFIYIATYGSLNPLRYYPDKNKFNSTNDNGKHYPPFSFSCYLGSKGDTLFSNEKKGIWILSKEETIKNDTLGQVFGITEDIRGDLWLAAWYITVMDFKGGIFRYDGKKFQNYKTSFGISDGEIWTVFYDHEQDILWIGTLNEGLVKAPFTAISNYPSSYFKHEKQKINDVYFDTKGTLWIAGSRELIRMEPNGIFSSMDKHQMMLSYRKYWNYKNKLSNLTPGYLVKLTPIKMDDSLHEDFEKRTEFNFYRVIEDIDHTMIYSNELGLFQYQEAIQKTNYLGKDGPYTEISVSGDTLFYSGEFTSLNPNFRERGKEILNNSTFRQSPFIVFSKKSEPKAVTRFVKQNKQYWYTTMVTGLWMSEGMKLVNFNESDSTISNNLNDICFDKKGNIIFGSNSGEIDIATLVDNKLRIKYRINCGNGLQGNSISWLVADQKGKLWAGTNLGLNCIDLDQLYTNGNPVIRFLDEEDGYVGQSSKRAVINDHGILWIAADEQLIRLDTRSFLSSQIQSGKVILKALEINRTPADSILNVKLHRLPSLHEGMFTLNHSENNLIFYFDILNFRNSQKDRFRCQLQGYDKTWSSWGEGRKAVYTNLHPGNYRLLVESYNINSPGQAEPLSIEFTILYPWWGLWYLQVLSISFLLLLAGYILWKYFQKEKAKQLKNLEIEKTIAHLEMHALQAQMNPHFIFNCMNNIQYFVLANQMDKALVYLSDFSKVLRASLVNANLRMVHMDQEIDFLNSYLRLEQMRFPDKFDYVIQSFDKENARSFLMPPMLVQPFAENAIRHGFMNMESKGNLSIIFERVEIDLLKCSVIDNGIGRDNARKAEQLPLIKDRQHSGTITESRIQLFNPSYLPAKYQLIYIDLFENDKPCGLKVELYLPMELGKG